MKRIGSSLIMAGGALMATSCVANKTASQKPNIVFIRGNLELDPGETCDLSARYPDVLARLSS